MAVNKVVYGETTVIDITDSTVSANKLKSGETAYGADGTKITGTLVVPEVLDDLSDVVITTPQTAQEIYYDGTEWINYGAKILLTFDDDFRGQTITLTKGQTTITKTAPLSGNTMNLYVNETGTWTISSEISEVTYETEVNVTTFGTSFDAELVIGETVPEGATVTPTDDIQIWLACANLNKPYTTLDAVLADRETFETLIADSNACDYMARSTSWAVEDLSEGLVPAMTSNTTPSGTITGDAGDLSHYYKIFDGSYESAGGHVFEQGSLTNGLSVTYTFDHDINIGKVGYHSTDYSAATSYLKSFTLNVSIGNNGTFTQIGSRTFTQAEAQAMQNSWGYIDCDYSTGNAVKITITASNYNYNNMVIIGEIQFFDVISIPQNQDAMSLIGKYDYCSNALLGNATWCEAIANSDYFEEIYNLKNPNMTSNTTPSGVASASSVYNNLAQYQAWKAFNGTNVDSADTWASAVNSSVNSYIQYQFTESKEISMIRWENRKNASASSVCSPKTYKIQGYDGSAWVDLTEELTNSDNSTGAKHTVWVTKNKASYQYYRMFIINAWTSSSDTYCCVAEFQLYGRESNEVLVDIIHSCPNDTIYYMEDGSPVIVATTNSDGDGVLDFSSLEDKEYTFYSSVAKDPSNLSNDFSKTIRITKSEFGGTTEMYLMPDTVKTLYWWGYEGSDLQDITNANGWTLNNTSGTPTHNTTNISVVGNSGEGSKTKVNVSKVSVIGSRTGNDGASLLAFSSSKDLRDNQGNYSQQVQLPTAFSKTETSITQGDYYVVIWTGTSRTVTLNAFWYE